MGEVVVAILNWNGRSHLETFLPSVLRHSQDARIVVIDNASTDDSVAFLQSHFPSVTIVKNDSNSGFAGGYNEGLAKIEANYAVLLNSDVEVSEGWLEPMLQLMERDASVAAVQPRIRAYSQPHLFEYAGAAGGFLDKDLFPFCRGRIFDELEEDRNQYASDSEIFWATGACMLVRMSAFREVEGFDAGFFAHMEEIDLCWRFKNRGYKVMYCADSKVYHLGGGTLAYGNPRKTYLNFRNNLFLIYKNYYSSGLFLKLFRRLSLDGVAGLKFLFAGKFAHFFAILKAHFSFYCALPRLLRQRRTLRNTSVNSNLAGLYRRSITFDFFLKKRKKFSQLDEPAFVKPGAPL